MRIIATGQLGELLSSGDTDQAQDARLILENLAKDEDYEVASEAQKQISNFEKLIKDRDAAGKAARLKAEEEERKRIAKEKAEKETAEQVSLLRNKFNRVTQLERSGYLEDALNICYEIKSIDPKYPKIEKKVHELEKAIRLRDIQKEDEERQRIAKEKADREAAEKALLIAEEEERKRIATEKAQRDAAEKAAREKDEKAAAELATLLYGKLNKAIQLERSGYLDEALKIYYEIKSADSKYPNIENKIRTVENAILKAKEEEQKRIAREKAKENPYLEKVRLISGLISQAINLEESGSLDAALKVYYEIKSIDPRYPTVAKKIQDIENAIRIRDAQKQKAANKVNFVPIYWAIGMLVVFFWVLSSLPTVTPELINPSSSPDNLKTQSAYEIIDPTSTKTATKIATSIYPTLNLKLPTPVFLTVLLYPSKIDAAPFGGTPHPVWTIYIWCIGNTSLCSQEYSYRVYESLTDPDSGIPEWREYITTTSTYFNGTPGYWYKVEMLNKPSGATVIDDEATIIECCK